MVDSNARDLELATKERVDLRDKLSAADSKIAELSAALEMAKKEREDIERKHEEAIYTAQVQLCNAYIDIKVLKHDTTVVGQFPCSVAAARKGQIILELVKKDMFNYLTTGKLMAVDWAKSQGCSFNFSGLDLDNTEGFKEAVAKVNEDLKSLDLLQAEAENFNSFPEEIVIPPVPEALKSAVDQCLAKEPPPKVPKLSKRRIRIFSEIDLNAKLKLPRTLSDDLNVGDEVPFPRLGE